MNTTKKRSRSVWMLGLLAGLLLLAGVAAGCKSASTTNSGETASGDQKAMLEAVAKWYVAQGQLDLAGYKAGIYDPDDILGVATMTAIPEGSEKMEVKWEWSGDKIVVTVPSEESTITMSASPNQANVVLLADALGQGGTYVMKKDGGVWKIDVAETQKVSEAEASAESGVESSTATTEAP